jgi:hypothetical protein
MSSLAVISRQIAKQLFRTGAVAAGILTTFNTLAADDRRLVRGFYVNAGFNFHAVPLGEDFTKIEEISSLPPGNYIANASAVLASGGQDIRFVDCRLKAGSNILSELASGRIGGIDSNNFITLPIIFGFTIKRTANLELLCRSDASGAVVLQPSPITAIRVDRLTVQK